MIDKPDEMTALDGLAGDEGRRAKSVGCGAKGEGRRASRVSFLTPFATRLTLFATHLTPFAQRNLQQLPVRLRHLACHMRVDAVSVTDAAVKIILHRKLKGIGQ